MYLLDTNVVIQLRDYAEHAAHNLLTLPRRPSISAVTRVELEGGVHADPARRAGRRSALDAILRRFEVIDFNEEMAIAYGDIVRVAGFSRRKIIDRMIAATALVSGLTLVTLNQGDFADIEGLDVRDWNV